MAINHSPQQENPPSFAKRSLKLLKSLALLGVLSSIPAFAQYGDTLTISGLSEVPAGWVITHIAYRAPVFYGTPTPQMILENQTLTIKDLAGAPSGARETVLQTSTIPYGWVIVERSRPVFNQPNHKPTFVIQNTNRQ